MKERDERELIMKLRKREGRDEREKKEEGKRKEEI